MRKYAVVLYVRNEGSTSKFYPWAFIVEANRYHTEVHSVSSVQDVPDSID